MKKQDETLEIRRQRFSDGEITEHPGGYRTMIAHSGANVSMLLGAASDLLAYIELPKGHPDVGKSYNNLSPEVNGGLTYGNGRIFGWDYCHAHNDMDVESHVRNALEYFRGREKR